MKKISVKRVLINISLFLIGVFVGWISNYFLFFISLSILDAAILSRFECANNMFMANFTLFYCSPIVFILLGYPLD